MSAAVWRLCWAVFNFFRYLVLKQPVDGLEVWHWLQSVFFLPRANGWKHKFHENCCNSCSINVLYNEQKKAFGMPLLFYLDVSKDGHKMRHSSVKGVFRGTTSKNMLFQSKIHLLCSKHRSQPRCNLHTFLLPMNHFPGLSGHISRCEHAKRDG